jgi:hypothetical protein
MSTPYEIPLSAQPSIFQIALAGTTYACKVYWCPPSASWVLDIAGADETPIISGIPLLTGCDLLFQHKYLNLKGGLWVQSDVDLYAVPDFTSLGTQGHLYFLAD